MNNGARKGGVASAWQIMKQSEGLEDIWQLHFAVRGGKENNSPDMLIANVDEVCEGKWLKLTAQKDRSFTIYNARNKYEKGYAKR
jgi:competence protein ComEC